MIFECEESSRGDLGRPGVGQRRGGRWEERRREAGAQWPAGR